MSMYSWKDKLWDVHKSDTAMQERTSTTSLSTPLPQNKYKVPGKNPEDI